MSSKQGVVTTEWGTFLAPHPHTATAAQCIADAIRAHDAISGGTACLKLRPSTKVTRSAAAATSQQAGWPPEVVVKEVRPPSRRRLGHRLGIPSRFAHDFDIVTQLTQRGIYTPRLLATSKRPRRAEYQLTEFLAQCCTVRELLWLPPRALTTAEERQRAITALGHWVGKLHGTGVWQRDLKMNNVLVSPPTAVRNTFDFYLLDFSDVRFFEPTLPDDKRVRNLGQVLDVPQGVETEIHSIFLPAYIEAAPPGSLSRNDLKSGITAAVEARRQHRQQADGFRYVDEPIETLSTMDPL